MKKLFVIAVLLMSMTVGCVNGKFEVPDQADQEKTNKVNLVQFTF